MDAEPTHLQLGISAAQSDNIIMSNTEFEIPARRLLRNGDIIAIRIGACKAIRADVVRAVQFLELFFQLDPDVTPTIRLMCGFQGEVLDLLMKMTRKQSGGVDPFRTVDEARRAVKLLTDAVKAKHHIKPIKDGLTYAKAAMMAKAEEARVTEGKVVNDTVKSAKGDEGTKKEEKPQSLEEALYQGFFNARV